MITLDEQIEYMRDRIALEQGRITVIPYHCDRLKAILSTLEKVRDGQQTECRHGVPLAWNCNACSDSGDDPRGEQKSHPPSNPQ